jgi:hypothetical protein
MVRGMVRFLVGLYFLSVSYLPSHATAKNSFDLAGKADSRGDEQNRFRSCVARFRSLVRVIPLIGFLLQDAPRFQERVGCCHLVALLIR